MADPTNRRILDRRTRKWLLDRRVRHMPHPHGLDPHSPEYLYLVQQARRLSLSASVARLRPRNLLQLPVVIPIVLLKVVDLWITNQIIRAMINERDLLRQSQAARDRPG